MKKALIILLTILISANVFAQGHFVLAYDGVGQSHMNFNILSSTFDGQNLVAGDEIAIFDGTICCGKIILNEPIVFGNPQTYVTIAASMKDDTLSNGYTEGNPILFKFWKSSTNQEVSAITANFLDPNTQQTIPAPTFEAFSSAFVKLSYVTLVNQAPVSNAGPDQSINESAIVILDGTASSDPDNNTLTYLWTAPSGITLSSGTASRPTFTAPEVQSNTNYTFSLIVNDGKVNSIADQVIITVKQTNKAPIANAGPDQSVLEGSVGILDGTASSDADSDVLTYLWTAPTGITLSSNTAAKPTFTAPEVQTNTNYTFSLIVNDGQVNSIADQVIVTVKQSNKAPEAKAGPDQTVNEGVLVTLNGSASSDPDNDALTYSWTAPPGINLSSASASKPTFTAPEVQENTNYTFSLVVNDGTVSSSDQVTITVKQVNKAPVANAGSDQSMNESTQVTLNGSASADADNDAITYLWTAPSGITLSSTTASMPTFTAPEVQINTNYTFSLVVNDGIHNSLADQVIITVKQINKLPGANAGPDQSLNEGVTVTLDGSLSSDPDNDALTYLWTAPPGITLSSGTASKPTFTAPEVQSDMNYTFSLVVNDGTANSTADQVFITVKQVNKAPVANAGPDQLLNEGTLVTLNGLSSTDADNDALTYLWSAPSGITLSSNAASKPTFTAPEVQTNTNYTFSLVVNDGKVNSTTDQVVVNVKHVNKTPVANAGSDKIVTEGKLVTLDGSLSSDPDNDVITYSWTSADGILLNSAKTAFPTFIAPSVLVNTNYTFNLIVNDGKINSSPDPIVITVIPNRAPSANAGPDLFVKKNSLFVLDGSGSSDPDGDQLTYKWTAPSGIILSSTTDQKPSFITPDINAITNLVFTLVVNDGKKDSPPDQVILTIKSDNLSPVSQAGNDQSVIEGSIATLDGTGSSDPDGDILTYFWSAPSGITLSSNTASKPTFTAPEVQYDTDFVFSLVVNDGTVNSISDQVIVKVKQVNKIPVANAGSDKMVDEGALVTLDGKSSTDPDNNKLTYFWSAPLGIVLSSADTPNPTFTAPNVIANTYYIFSLVVNDGQTNSVADQVIITVRHVNKAPLAYAGSDLLVNEGEKVTLNGSGSSDPDNNGITFLWTAPQGITLSSTQDSKPTFTAPEVSANTVYTFQLTVNDGSLNSVADQVNIVVGQVNKAPISNAGPNQMVTGGSMVTLDASGSTDPDNDNMTYQWTAPPGITLSSSTNPKPTFIASETETNTDYVFTLVVNDGTVNSSEDQVIITVIPHNDPPVSNAGIDVFVNENELVSLDGSASADPEHTGLTYLWTAPQGIKLSSATDPYPFFYAPEVMADTTLTVSLIVSDGISNSNADQVLIHVRQVNKAPVYTSSKLFYTNVNEPFEFLLEGSDMDHDPVNIKINDLPSFLTLSKNTSTSATLSGTFDDQTIENYFLTVVLSDGSLMTEETITINITKDDHSPYVKDSIPNISVDRRSPAQSIDLNSVFADDDPGDILDFSILSNTNPGAVNAMISGTNLILSFSTETAGSAEIAVNAISKGKIVTLKFQVEVKNPTGIDFQEADAEIQIFPNPTTGIIQVNLKQIPAPNTWIRIYDPSGRMIEKKSIMGKSETLNLENYSPGIYFIKVDPASSKIHKVILK